MSKNLTTKKATAATDHVNYVIYTYIRSWVNSKTLSLMAPQQAYEIEINWNIQRNIKYLIEFYYSFIYLETVYAFGSWIQIFFFTVQPSPS